MSECVLMISDLHLSEQHPETVTLFEYFIQKKAAKALALYILGDFFEAWIGDDNNSALAKKISKILFDLSQSGVKIYFMQGNRDFLVGRDYCERSGMTLIEDPQLTNIFGHLLILSHGDVFCTDDKNYMRFRHIVRTPRVQKLFLALPLKWRKKIAQMLRGRSQKTQMHQQGQWCEVNQDAVQQLMHQHKTANLIHGHTHAFKVYAEESWTRYVLGDWDGQTGSYIEVKKEGVILKSLKSPRSV